MKDKVFPKLPDQDDFLMDLQNSNYSPLTIHNYARDLCIFAVFINFRGVEFKDVSKKDISMYKGYLKAGEHLKDLDRIRKEFVKNAGIQAISGAKAASDDLSHDTDMGAMNTPVKKEVFEVSFLESLYNRVYGSLGIFERPMNTNARKKSGLDVNSINRMLSSVRSYLKFRVKWDLEIPLPADAVDMMKAEKRVKKVASLQDLTALIESPLEFESDERVAIRNRCMLEMLFASGMRISELINLDLENINVEGKMYIIGKGKKERSVYLTQRSLDWLNKYLSVRLKYAFTNKDTEEQPGVLDKLMADVNTERETSGDELNLEIFDKGNRKYISLVESYRQSGFLEKFDSPALFIPFSGGRYGKVDMRISTNYFQEKIAEYRRKLGIQIPTSAHSLRHGFATYLAEQGASPVALQALLGHESLNTTTKYVHASEKFAEETVRKNHPLK
jgi:site-specific recombinase XerD